MTRSPEERIGVRFRDSSLLTRALTHRSYLNESNNEDMLDNQRLEFLGDAVLDFIAGEMLFHRFPQEQEGRLTRLRAALVRTETLADFARDCGINDLLLLGRGEEDNDGRNRDSNLCDAFEAVIGALYLDSGIDAVSSFVMPLLEEALEDVIGSAFDKDPKSALQEWSQRHLGLIPTYDTIEERGPDHRKEFTIAVSIAGQERAYGVGHSKRSAAQSAARALLNDLDALLEAIQQEEA